MRENLLQKYYRLLIAEFNLNFQKAALKIDEPSIHDLRVTSKKIYSLFLLLEVINPSEFSF